MHLWTGSHYPDGHGAIVHDLVKAIVLLFAERGENPRARHLIPAPHNKMNTKSSIKLAYSGDT